MLEQDFDEFSAPIPGQSLTDTPGNFPWEKPPRFTDPDEALDEVFERLSSEDGIIQTIALLEAGLSVEAIVRTIMFAGFAQGHWTPDVALLIAEPLYFVVAAIGKKAGVKDLRPLERNRTKIDDLLDDINMVKEAQKSPASAELAGQISAEMQQSGIPTGGLMGMPVGPTPGQV